MSNKKTFELRKDKDDIQVGDMFVLKEWNGDYTGQTDICKVTYVLRNSPNYGLMEGYCIIGIQNIGWNHKKLEK